MFGTLASFQQHYLSLVSIMAVLQGSETQCLESHPEQLQMFFVNLLLISVTREIMISVSEVGKLRPGIVGLVNMN